MICATNLLASALAGVYAEFQATSKPGPLARLQRGASGNNGAVMRPRSSQPERNEIEPRRFREIVARLEERYGRPAWRPHGPPLDELIATVLSQHTSDVNTARSYASLRTSFPDWGSVAEATTSQVADAIRCGGLAGTKAPRIQAILRTIEAEIGELSLDWLAKWGLPEARAWLTSLPGVGPKTAGCVLLFSLGLPAMPVDTHVHRVSRRLGLIGERVSAETAHESIERAVGHNRDDVYALHVNLIRHGRAVCRARNPACSRCNLVDLCPAANRFLVGQCPGGATSLNAAGEMG